MDFFRAETLRDAIHYIERMFLYRDWWSLFDGTIYNIGLDVKEVHILWCALLILFIVDFYKYKTGKLISQFLSEQWIVFRWFVLFVLIFGCIIWGYYGPGFDSAQFIYLQF